MASGDSQFTAEIDDANATLEADPENVAALLALARTAIWSASSRTTTDDQGNEIVTEDATADFEDSIDAWERYLEANKDKKADARPPASS